MIAVLAMRKKGTDAQNTKLRVFWTSNRVKNTNQWKKASFNQILIFTKW